MDYTDTVKEMGFLNFDSGFKMPELFSAPKPQGAPVGIITSGGPSVNTAAGGGGVARVAGAANTAAGGKTPSGGGAASYSWITQGVGALVGTAGSFFEKQMESDTARSIASGDQNTKERIALSQLDAEAFIQANHDLTAIEIEKIRAMAAINKPVDNSRNWIIIGVFSFLIVSTVGILYIGNRQNG
jgi:hypothetical protein